MTSILSVSPEGADRTTGPLVFLYRLLANWSRRFESRFAAYLLFAVVYVVPNLVLANQKLIWDDEFFTLYLSTTADWSELWRALSTGADQHPPSFYYLTHLIFKVAGASHITLRLTALVGFGLCCVCLYEISRRLIGRRWAIVALLAPLTTPTLYYATEARGYGLELGFVTFSLLMWILAAEGHGRPWTVPALAVGMCVAVGAHYYAVLFVGPLAVGEILRARLRRSVDIPVCAALLGAFIPLAAFAPLILRAKTYSAHFWAVPIWGQMLLWYPGMIGRMSLILLAAAALAWVLRIRTSEDSQESAPMVSTPVVIAVIVSALLPVIGMFVAQLFTHAFTERYFIAALPGVVIIMLWGLKRMLRNDLAGPALASVVCLILFVPEWRGHIKAQAGVVRQMRSIATLLRRAGDVPILVTDYTTFNRLSFYAQRDLASRLVYAADPHLSVRYLGHDTIDRGILDLAPWFPLRVAWWHEWWSARSNSLVYGSVSGWTWHTFALDKVGTAQLLSRDLDRFLLNVNRTKVPENDRTPADPEGKPSLYDTLALKGASLCKIYFSSEACPVVDDPRYKEPIITYPDWLILK